MNPRTGKEAEKWFSNIAKLLSGIRKTEVVVCSPFLYLERLAKIRTSKLKLGTQDAFFGDTGPFTGEVSSEMLYEAGARYVILGHSERRALGEANELINKKLKSALASGLLPIVCIGEKERDTEHNYFEIVKSQLVECLKGVSKDSISKIIFAYEPVWSISTTENRRDATSGDAREMVIFIRKVLSDISSHEVAHKTRVLYGGSVTSKDAEDFLKNGEVDGLLVGKASLEPKRFLEIVKICETLNK